MFASADVRIGGGRPFDIKVTDGRFYNAVIQDGMLGFGESYMDGLVDSEAWLVRGNLEKDRRG
jgi:cyclopropane-fatty-acyl-phospholipid synthase